MIEKNRAVFLDRDGTINVEKNYLYRCDEFSFLPGVPQALKRLQKAGFLLVVVTNQSGVARGYYTLHNVETLHIYMQQLLQEFGVDVSGIYVCPHHPDGVKGGPFSLSCDCRKGRPGLLLKAAKELEVDLSQSYMIGDKLSDIEAGHRAGCASLLIASEPDQWLNSDLPEYCEGIFPGLEEAANHLLETECFKTSDGSA